MEKQIKPTKEKLEVVYEEGDQFYIIVFGRGKSSAWEFTSELFNDDLRTKDGKKIDQPPMEFLGCFDTVSMQF